MSTPAAEPGEFVVITEVGPKENEGASSKTRPKIDPQQKFLKGEPLALGVTQILCGFFQIFFAIVCDVNEVTQSRRHEFPPFFSRTSFYSAIPYIICGSLSVAASKNPRIGLVRGSLVLNIITAVASGVTIYIYALRISVLHALFVIQYDYCDQDMEPEICHLVDEASNVSFAILCIMLVLSILGFCLSVSTSAFGCKTLCRTAYSEVSVVIYQTRPTQPTQPDVSVLPLSHPDADAILPSFKESENPQSDSPIEKL